MNYHYSVFKVLLLLLFNAALPFFFYYYSPKRYFHFTYSQHRSEVDKSKQKLLEDIKKQQQKQDLKVNTMQAATALVNDMLLNGFHITPPDETPRLSLEKTSQHSISEDHLLGPIEEKKLVVAMYYELKRIQKTHTEIANSP